jgi:predicted alpha/beta hydrolase
MTEQLRTGRVAYVQGRSARGGISRDFSAEQARERKRSFSVRDPFGPVLRERFRDGLTLHVRRYGSHVGTALPVVCLPGLARTAADLHPLAEALAADPAKPRLVLALDYRGHGRSEYVLPLALADLSAVLTALEVAPAIFLGTSYGGLLAMMLAV